MDLRAILPEILYGKLNSPRSGGDGPAISEVLREIGKRYPKLKLEDLLRFDREKGLRDLTRLRWYHGNVTRDHATQILMTGPDIRDGCFLVRDNSSKPDNYTLSVFCTDRVKHYQIERKSDAFFKIDNSPVIFGLDKLISYYQEEAHGLVHRLTTFPTCRLPPQHDLRFGYTNILHRAVKEVSRASPRPGNSAIVRKILTSPECPDLNAKNSKGSTVLHTACSLGFDDITLQLLRRDVSVHLRDSHGATPLHRATAGNRANTARILITLGHANPQERRHPTAIVPMHEAAVYGHTETVKVLLSLGVPCWPRNDDGDTPYQLALRHGHDECADILGTYRSPPATTQRADWYHAMLSRQDANSLLEQYASRDGVFLVRDSSRHPTWFVMSVIYDKTPYHFEIKMHTTNMYFIDDGPLMESVEHLIDHYMTYDDGLPCVINTALSRDGSLKGLHPINPHLQLAEKFGPSVYEFDDATDIDDVITGIDGFSEPMYDIAATVESSLRLSSDSLNTSEDRDSPRPPKPLIQIPVTDIKLGNELGQGEFGAVYEAEWKKPGASHNVRVAVKTLHPVHVSTGHAAQFLSEAEVMVQLNHSCIVQLIGVSAGPPMMIIEELLPMGSLLDYVWEPPGMLDVKTDLYLWAAQIASGMMYLERKKFVHRDLAARNVLMASHEQAKISDFGLSRAVGSDNDYYRSVRGGRWPVKWYAPECINYGTFSHASDVWSYGVTLWEMFSFGSAPYENVQAKDIIQYVENGGRLECPQMCPEQVYDIMTKCWCLKPQDRPTFAQLYSIFRTDPEYSTISNLLKSKR